MICQLCLYPFAKIESYDADALRYMKSEGRICEVHGKEADILISKAPSEPKKVVLTTAKQWVPPIATEPQKNWHEREPGSDDD